MRRIKSTNIITVAIENTDSGKAEITVKEHWNDKTKLVIIVDDKSYTVKAMDLIKAIQNAQNAH